MDTQKCPYCGRTIHSGASRCRYCQEWLTLDGLPPTQPIRQDPPVRHLVEVKEAESVVQKTGFWEWIGGHLVVIISLAAIIVLLTTNPTAPARHAMKIMEHLEEQEKRIKLEASNKIYQVVDKDLADLIVYTGSLDGLVEESFDDMRQNVSNDLEVKNCWLFSIGRSNRGLTLGVLGMVFDITLPLMDTRTEVDAYNYIVEEIREVALPAKAIDWLL